MQIEPGAEGLGAGAFLRGLVRTLLPPETTKAVAALLELELEPQNPKMPRASHCSVPRLQVSTQKILWGLGGPLSYG